MLKNALATIGRGFLLGMGFTIAACGVGFFVQMYWLNSMQQVNGMASVDALSDATHKNLVLSDLEEQKSDGRDFVISTIKNTGSEPARGVTVEVDLFLKDKYVDQYSTYISGSMKPGESRHFKIECGCKGSPPAEHDSFKATVRTSF